MGIEDKIRHSVLMITYNQENLLPIALESLFRQSELPYEVIISDDCSTDSTWNVICHYYALFPDIIRPIRNEKNLGVFANFNNIMHLPTGDIVSCLSGDDFYKLGIFETFSNEVKKENLSPQKDKFTLICNSAHLSLNGREVVCNNYQFRQCNLFKVKIRYGLDFRDTGFSIALWREIMPIRTDIGYHADWLYCIDQVIKSDKFIFIDKVFPVYRVGVGVVSKSKHELLAKSRLEVIDALINEYASRLDEDDILYLKKDYSYSTYILTRSFKSLLRFIVLVIQNRHNYTNEQIKKCEFRYVFIAPLGLLMRKLRLK